MRRPTWPILTALCLLLALPAAASAAGRVEVRKGVVYESARVSAPAAGSTELLLDLYRPAKRVKVARPVVILIHGGGFVGGSRTDPGIVRVARGLAERGVVVASIDYRLMGQKPVPSPRVAPLVAAVPKVPIFVAMTTAVDDALSAVDYLRGHARRLRIDPSRLGLIGSSAGAITASHVAYALDDHGIKGPKVRFVASLWGGMFVPAPTGLGTDAAAQLERGEAALFAVHGDADRTLPVTLDDQLVARARRQRVRNEYHRIPGGGHGYDASGFFTRAVVGEQTPYDRLLRFAEAALHKRASRPSSAGAGAQPLHYAAAVEGTDAFIGIAKRGRCFKAYLSDGSGVATLSVNRGRGPTGTTYNRLYQAIAALDERIFAIERQLYECA